MSDETNKKIGLWGLVGMVIGSIISGAIFDIPQNMAASSALGPVIIAWVITVIGMLMLAYTFKILSDERPDLHIGIYSYAREGFGKYIGFNSAWGYWISAATGNVAFAVMLNDAFGYWFPVMLKHSWPTIIFGLFLIWFYNFLVMRGIKQASSINTVTVVIKFIGLLGILAAMCAFFNWDTATADMWGQSYHLGSITSQVEAPMLVTLWAFIGIEGAVVISNHAKKSSDVGKATVIGFLIALAAYFLLSVLAFGIYQQPELANLTDPSTGYILATKFSPHFVDFVNICLLVSVGGAWVAWTILAAQLPYAAAKGKVLPKVFAHENSKNVPDVALIVSSIIMSIFMVLVCTAKNVYMAAIDITGVIILPSYLLSSLYLLKAGARSEIIKDKKGKRIRATIIGFLSTIYCLWLLYAANLSYLLVATIVYAVGILFYMQARRDDHDGKPSFTGWEALLAIIITLLAIYAIYLLCIGQIAF